MVFNPNRCAIEELQPTDHKSVTIYIYIYIYIYIFIYLYIELDMFIIKLIRKILIRIITTIMVVYINTKRIILRHDLVNYTKDFVINNISRKLMIQY